jgi:hypothetical protein
MAINGRGGGGFKAFKRGKLEWRGNGGNWWGRIKAGL